MFSPLMAVCQEAERELRGTGYIPDGFLRAALDTRDGEATWSGVALYFLLKEFGLL